MSLVTFRDGGSERGFAVVDVADGANVHVRLVSGEHCVRVPHHVRRGGGRGHQQLLLLLYEGEKIMT